MHRISKLAELFMRFPGIGPRQAGRFVFFLLQQDREFVEALSRSIADIRGAVAQCPSCFRFFDADGYSHVCDICGSPNRDASLLMVVEKDADLNVVEKSNAYSGKYFVLGGTVPLMEQVPGDIRMKELLIAVEARAGELREIIIATSANPEGDMTADYVRRALEPVCLAHNIMLSTLGRGLSTGTELEYSDADTIKNALKNRQ